MFSKKVGLEKKFINDLNSHLKYEIENFKKTKEKSIFSSIVKLYKNYYLKKSEIFGIMNEIISCESDSENSSKIKRENDSENSSKIKGENDSENSSKIKEENDSDISLKNKESKENNKDNEHNDDSKSGDDF